MSILTGVWEKWVPALVEDVEGFKTQWRKSLQMWRKQPES